MAGDIRAHLRTTAEGYLFLKGAAGATLIQMKAAKLFKGVLHRSKALALGVDLGDVLEELMDEGKVSSRQNPTTLKSYTSMGVDLGDVLEELTDEGKNELSPNPFRCS
eukprot:2611963-Pyramimonas_sp.AAC.1